MGFQCGIIGQPNVGKSTIFNALTSAGAASANYPFCTIEPNVGVVPVADFRLNRLAALVQPASLVPTTMEFVDIAGLVKGASQGEGLGNQFLGHIRQVEAVAHVVRCFDDDDVVHVDGTVDPRRDAEVIQTELNLADLETVAKRTAKIRKQAHSGDKQARQEMALLERLQEALEAGWPVRSLELDSQEKSWIRGWGLLTAKPLFYVANVEEEALFEPNAPLQALQEHAQQEGSEVVPICGRIEAELVELSPEERQEYLAELGLEEPGLARLIRAGYRMLSLLTYFTAGPKEVRAWTVPTGSTAPQAAGKIHSDFERGFIRAEVVAWDKFLEAGGEQACRDKGLMRVEGKEYIVVDGDVIHFRFNV